MGKKVRLGPSPDQPVPDPKGSAPPPPVLPEDTPKGKAGLPDPVKKDGGAPDQPKVDKPVRIANARPKTARSKPKPMPKRLVTKRGASPERRDRDPKAKTAKGKPKPAPKAAFKALEDMVQEEGSVELSKPKPRPVFEPDPEDEPEKKTEEPEGEEDGDALAKNEPPRAGARGEVAPGKDPAADEEGFIPLTEALRRAGSGGAPADIVPNWISSNMSQDGDVGLDEYKRALLDQITRAKVVPPGYDPMKFTGAAIVAGTVDGYTGRLISVWLVDTSGRRDLDRAAIQTIVRAAPFPPIGTMGVLRFQMAIRYGPAEQQASR